MPPEPQPAPPPRIDAEMLRIFLLDRDAPCPTCNYNLRALNAETCPECGTSLALGLTARAPLSQAKRRLIAALAWLFLATSLIRTGYGVFFLWRIYFTNAFGSRLPAYYAIRHGGEAVVEGGLAIAALIGLIGLRGPLAHADRRYRRCLTIIIVCVAVELAKELILYFTYLLF